MVLNYDNDESKNIVDLCYRTTKTLINPIINWTESEVWEFLNSHKIQHCCLYDEGFKRIGCIGCPMGSNREKEFERWPKYKAMYLNAFNKMLLKGKEKGIEYKIKWDTPEDVMKWWIE